MVSGRFTEAAIQQVIRDVFGLCRALKVKATLIGATAVDAWGHARGTHDVDLLADFLPEDLPRIRNAMTAVGGTLDVQWAKENPLEDRMVRFRLRGVQIDLLRPLTPSARKALGRRKRKQCYGVTAWVVSLEDLLLMKLQVGRPRDVDDAVSLVIANPQLMDSQLLLAEIKQLRLGSEWRDLSERVAASLADPLG